MEPIQPTNVNPPALPALKPGWQSCEVILALLALLLAFAGLYTGRVDAQDFCLLAGGIIGSCGGFRSWLKARHMDKLAELAGTPATPAAITAVDATDQLLHRILEGNATAALDGEDIAKILTAILPHTLSAAPSSSQPMNPVAPKSADVPAPLLSPAPPSPAPIVAPSASESGKAGLSTLALLALLGASLFAACTSYNLPAGTGTTWGNSHKFKQVYNPGGQCSIEWEDMDHVSVWDAAGRFVGNVASGVADAWLASGVAKAVTRGDANGVQLLTATIPSGIQKATSRRTNRVPPKPVPVPSANNIPRRAQNPAHSSLSQSEPNPRERAEGYNQHQSHQSDSSGSVPSAAGTLSSSDRHGLYRSSPIALRPEAQTLYTADDHPIPPTPQVITHTNN